MNFKQPGQIKLEKQFDEFKVLFQEIMVQKSSIIQTLMNQNLFIDRQLQISNRNSYHLRNQLPSMYDKRPIQETPQHNKPQNLKLDYYQEFKISCDIDQERQKQANLQQQRNFPFQSSTNTLLERKIKEKSEQHKLNLKNQPQNSTLIAKEEKLTQKKSTYYHRKQKTGLLKDVPGNPLQNRYISEFFEKQAPNLITFTGKQQSLIYKKEFLACYLIWRLNQLPNQTKLKLVNIQVNISSYVRTNLKDKCGILRHCYSGMEFKSLEIVKSIKNFNFDKYKLYEKRGRSRIPETKSQFYEPDYLESRRNYYDDL